MRRYTFVDLFAGAGGFTEGLLLAEGKSSFALVAASDINPTARLTYDHRFKEQLGLSYPFLVEDIRDSVFARALATEMKKTSGCESVDIVIGGPPCQGFSVFGRRNEDDPRNDLFLPYLKVIEVLTPKYFVMENVPGLATMYGGKTVERIYREVERMEPTRYGITGPLKVSAAGFGVPQLRERILFIGYREDCPPIESIPSPRGLRPVSVEEAISDLAFLRPWESNGTYQPGFPPVSSYQRASRRGRLFAKYGLERQDERVENHEAARHTTEVIARFAMIEQGRGLESIPRPLWTRYLRSSKKWCVRLRPDRPSYTVTTLPDDLIHYKQHRILTVREVARLQSFDDTFVFLGPRATGGGGRGNKKRAVELPQYSQVGNAVPPLLAKGIGTALLETLDSIGTQ
jgi:DNA (cytosine-5)-methyltransferase 1